MGSHPFEAHDLKLGWRNSKLVHWPGPLWWVIESWGSPDGPQARSKESRDQRELRNVVSWDDMKLLSRENSFILPFQLPRDGSISWLMINLAAFWDTPTASAAISLRFPCGQLIQKLKSGSPIPSRSRFNLSPISWKWREDWLRSAAGIWDP